MSFGVGCRGCGEKLQKEAEAKQSRGESLTEHERRVIEADDPNDVVPRMFGVPVYGRLSSYDGVICRTCELAGYAGSIVIAVLLFVYLSTTSMEGQTVIGIAGGALVFQLLLVGFMGRYPILGPVLGPIAERMLSIGSSGGEPMRDQASNDDVDWDIKTDPTSDQDDLPEDYFDAQEQRFREQLKHYKTKIESLQNSLSQERSEKMELKQELDERREDVNELETTVQKKAKKVEKLEGRKDELKTAMRQRALYGGEGDEIPVSVLGEGAAEIQSQHWHKRTIETHVNWETYQGQAYFSLRVGVPGAPEPSNLPEQIDEAYIMSQSEYFFPDPDKVDIPPQYEHPGQNGAPSPGDPGYRDATFLFVSDKAQVLRERQEMLESDDVDSFTHVGLIYGYDKNQNPVDLPFNVDRFTTFNELQNELSRKDRLLQSARAQLDDKTRVITNISHALSVYEDKFDFHDGLIDDLMDQAQRATEQSMNFARRMESDRRQMEYLAEDNRHHAKMADVEQENRRKAQERQTKMATETQEMVEEYGNMSDRKATVDRVFNALQMLQWQPGNGEEPIDYNAITMGEDGRSKEDAVGMFLREETEEGEYRRLYKNAQQAVGNYLAADGGRG